MSSKATISVVIPLFEKRTTIVRAVRSLLTQTHPASEIIVVDDGSGDGGADHLEASINDPRLRIIRMENRGVSAARNRGIAEAQSSLVALLDADDEWVPEFLGVIANMAQRHPNACLYTCFNLRGGAIAARTDAGQVAGSSRELKGDAFFDFWYANPRCISSSSVCLDTEAYADQRKPEIFPENIARGEDLSVWIATALSGSIAVAPFDGAIIHDDSDQRASARPLREVPYPLVLFAEKWRNTADDTPSLRRLLKRMATRNSLALSMMHAPRTVVRYCRTSFALGPKTGLTVLGIAATPKPLRDAMLRYVRLQQAKKPK